MSNLNTIPTLNTIPVEISKLIEFYLENIDIKQLRLVCKTLKERANLRIPRVFISLYDVVLDAAINIIQHEEFSKGIEEIVWDNTQHQYPRSPRTYDYEEEIDAHREQFDLARCLFAAHRELMRSGRDLQVLRQALKLPNLKRVTVTSHIWDSINAGAPVYHLPLFRELYQESQLLPLYNKHYNRVLSETSSAGVNLKEFVVDVARHREYIGGGLFWHPDKATLDLQTICKNSPNLTRLDLALNAKLNWSQGVLCLETGLLKDLLSKLPTLEDLRIHANMDTDFGRPDSNPEFRPMWNTIEDVFPTPYTTHFPNLKHLKLGNLYMKTTSLISLITDLPSLQYADLDRPELCTTTGTFSHLLHELKKQLIDGEDGKWKEPKTRLTIHSDRRGSLHKIVQDDITAFFYEGRLCPYEAGANKPRMFWSQKNDYRPSDGIKCDENEKAS